MKSKKINSLNYNKRYVLCTLFSLSLSLIFMKISNVESTYLDKKMRPQNNLQFAL